MSIPLVPGKDLIYYSGLSWDESEVEAAVSSLRSGKWVAAGAKVTRFEHEFSRKFGHHESLMVNSGSSANLIMLSAMKKHYGWSDGDEIIVSVVGFPTTVAPVIQCGLTPVFIDIEMDSLNFDLEKLEAKVTPRTKAIFLSPVLGNPPDMYFINGLCLKHGLTLILDGCDSLGTKWHHFNLSDVAEATSCSFFPSHHLSTGEGGMVSSRDKELIKKARQFAWWGRDCWCVGAANALPCGTCGTRFGKHLGEESGVIDHKYVFQEIGYNMKPLDLQGAIGLEQLKKFDSLHEARIRIKNDIGNFLTENTDLHIPKELPEAEVGWFGVPVVCNSQAQKEKLVAHLESAKIQTRHYFAGNLLLHPGYRHLGNAKDYPEAMKVLTHVFFIGCHPSYSSDVISYIKEQFLIGVKK